MYNKEIYQEWEMHQDATQLEIKYKFLVKVIDILSIKSLIENHNNRVKEITDNKIIKKWQNYALEKTIENFYVIINDAVEFQESVSDDYTIFEKAIFLIGIIINELKKTNYKANEIEIYYEPRMFMVAEKNLKMEMLERWIISISSRVYDANINFASQDPMDLSIRMNEQNISNIMWFVENLCLSFKDISTWYNNLFSISDINSINKSVAMNIMNHMIVYSLCDFYVKLKFYNAKHQSFSDVYNNVLANVKKMLKEGKFAINAYKSISNFIAKILADHYIKSDDPIVENFLKIINISCSYNNKKYFEEEIFKLIEEENNKSYNNEASISSNDDIYIAKANKISEIDSHNDEQEEWINHHQKHDTKNGWDEQIEVVNNTNKNEGIKLNENDDLVNLNPNGANQNYSNVKIPTRSLNYPNTRQLDEESRINLENKSRLITKNLNKHVDMLDMQSLSINQPHDEIQRIIDRKTSFLSKNKPTYDFNDEKEKK